MWGMCFLFTVFAIVLLIVGLQVGPRLLKQSKTRVAKTVPKAPILYAENGKEPPMIRKLSPPMKPRLRNDTVSIKDEPQHQVQEPVVVQSTTSYPKRQNSNPRIDRQWPDKYWCDWKHKLKKRSQLVGKNKLRLTKLDKKALAILGGCDQKANDSALDEDFDCNDSPPIIKLEACDDVDSNHLSGDEQTSDVDSECNNNDAVNDSDQNSSDPLLSNIYPKWLIEVEKKRAEAELLRAKAEEQRASVAAKTAEAALIQAEALKKLAEATSNQADALMRIATVLEARGESDVLSIGRF